MARECRYDRKPDLIEAFFDTNTDAAGYGARTIPRAILSTVDAGNLRYQETIPNPLRRRFLERQGISENRILAFTLAHSKRVLTVKNTTDASELTYRAHSCGGADGLLSTDPQFIPSVTVADCMPIWLWVEDSSIFGVLHSGWKGTGILATAIAVLNSELGVLPEKVHAILGPAIGSCCYIVDKMRACNFAQEFGAECISERAGSWFIDLRKANEKIAESLGIGSVSHITLCTQCDAAMGSSRRQGRESFTRMLALCGFF